MMSSPSTIYPSCQIIYLRTSPPVVYAVLYEREIKLILKLSNKLGMLDALTIEIDKY